MYRRISQTFWTTSIIPSEPPTGKLGYCLPISVVPIWGTREPLLQEHFKPRPVRYLLSEPFSGLCETQSLQVQFTVSKLEIQPVFPLEKGFFQPSRQKEEKKVKTPLNQNLAFAGAFQVGDNS